MKLIKGIQRRGRLFAFNIFLYFLCLFILIFFLSFFFNRAALDSQSEKTVVAALNNAMCKTKSMVMVTHRLGVIRSLGVNKVVVLERGKVAEIGDPEILLNNKDGLYSQLAREQGIVPLSHDLNDFKPLAYS